MEYIDLVCQQCPPAVHQSVARAGAVLEPLEETLLFSEISSVALTASCAYGVVGHLSRRMSPTRSDTFKINYLSLVNQHASQLKTHGNASVQTQLRNDVVRAMHSIIDDITKSHLQGSMLAALVAFRIDVLSEIDKRVDYKSLTMKTYVADWVFNEYATCMGDPEGPERLERLFAKACAQELRNTFTEVWGKQVRGGYCLSSELIKQLVRPYLRDDRKTADVFGDGPPVSSYARELLDAL